MSQAAASSNVVKPDLRVTLVGHCGPDASFLRMAVSTALPGALVSLADTDRELATAIESGSDLLLFNRVLEIGFTNRDGVDLLIQVKQAHPDLRVMMVSNFPDTQQQAEAAGAEPGFGKREIGSTKVTQCLQKAVFTATA